MPKVQDDRSSVDMADTTSDDGQSSSSSSITRSPGRTSTAAPRRQVAKSSNDLAAEAAAAQRRLKHREYVKRSYQKKINAIQSLKSELESLENKYEAMLEDRQVLTPSVAAALIQAGGADLETPLMRSYLQLTELKTALQRENEELYQVNAEFIKAEGRAQQLLDTELQIPKYTPRFFIKSMKDSEFAKIIVKARDDILQFVNDQHTLTTGASVFGWTDKRKVLETETKFALKKHFRGISAYNLMQRTWDFVVNPAQIPRLYRAYLNTKYYIVQRINDDSLICFRTVSVDGSEYIAKTVFLLTRLKIDNGFMIFFRSIDKELVQFRESDANAVMEETLAILAQQPVRKEIWVEFYTWLIFLEGGASGSHFQFGGSAVTSMWFKEILFVTLQWETLIVGPPVMLEF